ncbi:hypothetical protein BGZ83_003794 [Gryganskiella cystojenkinii]|nr:hypothetical protein BGZ83_003794 [Gryganskiella cystojenkinii]
MFQANSYLSFHDLTPEGRFLWSSSNITDVLGYDPEELLGVPAYELLHPEDIPLTRVTHHENILNDLVASQIVLRYQTKSGGYIACLSIFSLCYDFILNCSTVVDPEDGVYRQIRAHSAAMTRLVGSRKQEFERIKRHHEAFQAKSWNPSALEPEPRACIILNRFARNLVVMYASASIELIFHVQPDQIVGKPFLLYIRADDLASFVEQVDMAKSSNIITHMRFWFQSPQFAQEIPCEAMIFGSSDGMVAVLRRCKPFVRKRLIRDGRSEPHGRYASTSATPAATTTTISSSIGRHSPGYGISTSAPEFLSSPLGGTTGGGARRSTRSSTRTSPYSVNNNHNTMEEGSSSKADHKSMDWTPTGSSSPLSTPSSSTSPPTVSMVGATPPALTKAAIEGTRKVDCPLRSLPMGSIECIRNLDQEHRSRVRPLRMVVPEENAQPVEPDGMIRRHHVQDFVEDDEDSS